ncbi:MAG: FAD-binding protein [Thermoleophilia bacterium]|nr:FAD-binding protein [Thermoleophilia bacterium]
MTAPVRPASPDTRGPSADARPASSPGSADARPSPSPGGGDPRRSSFPSSTDTRPRPAIADLHAYINGGLSPAARDCPAATLAMAVALEAAVAALHDEGAPALASLPDRLVTDASLRREAERDQNVYLGVPFTAWLTRARPDLVFLPLSAPEVEVAFAWAREHGVPVTIRGAASGALGGAVPNDGGLVLDLSRLDHIDVNPDDDVCVIGGGARFREIHRRLADHGLALPVYSSNLGGTFAGWLVSGASGLNGFGPGDAIDVVRAADVVLPCGDFVRFHADGRLDVPAEAPRRGHREVGADAAEAWFRGRGLEPFGLADLVGSEGVLGAVVQLVVAVGRRPKIGALLLPFDSLRDAFAAVEWVRLGAGRGLPRPANLKLVFRPFVHHVRRVWADEDVRAWHRRPSALSGGEGMPWERLAGPCELGAPLAAGDDGAVAYLYMDFLSLAAARAMARRLGEAPGAPGALADESLRFAAERFRPQQTKRLGPGMLAAEVRLPATRVGAYLKEAVALARAAGVELDPEVYYLSGGEALVIAGYLTDHRTAAATLDLAVSPVLVDLAVARHRGRPYVVGRWQAPFAAAKFGDAGLERLRTVKRALDPQALVNRGVVVDLALRGRAGALVGAVYAPGVRVARRLWERPATAAAGRAARCLAGLLAGPARGHGEPLGVAPPSPLDRPLHCVNCGECNVVCPVYDAARVRLPQTLVHRAELARAGADGRGATPALLQLCLRCGNCEEVCQAGIAHLDVYACLDELVDGRRSAGTDGHADLLAAVRGSSGYRERFLDVRPGLYLRRAPAALPGVVRFHVLRAENEDGPAATCLHCGACVPVCPTGANLEFEHDDDPRRITSDDERCIGCGACVEVCPANRRNGGQTLRVVQAPADDWLAALEEFETLEESETLEGVVVPGAAAPAEGCATAARAGAAPIDHRWGVPSWRG